MFADRRTGSIPFALVWPWPAFGSVDEVAGWFNISKDTVREDVNRAVDPAPHRLVGGKGGAKRIDTLGYYAWLQSREVR